VVYQLEGVVRCVLGRLADTNVDPAEDARRDVVAEEDVVEDGVRVVAAGLLVRKHAVRGVLGERLGVGAVGRGGLDL
jgi:hypothetical protein